MQAAGIVVEPELYQDCITEKSPELDGGFKSEVQRKYSEKLRRSAAGLSFVWLGDVQDMHGFLMSLNAFVMISDPAGCPNASMEAMAVGLPVVATDVGGASEQVIDQLNGYLIKDGDAESLASAIRILAERADLRQSMGHQSRQRAESHFTIDRMADHYGETFGLESPNAPEHCCCHV